MTLKELNEYGILKAHIEQCRDKIREINGRTVRSPVFNTSGISNSPTGRNPMEERYIKAIWDKEDLERHIAADETKIKRIERYISNIGDLRTRLIFEMHVYGSKQFFIIAMKLGGRNTEESVKQIFYRYLEKHPHG